MGLPLKTVPFYDNGAGLDTQSSPTKVAEDAASLCLNIDYSTDGAFFTRNGSTIQNVTATLPAQISGAPDMIAIYDFHKSDGTEKIISVGNDGKIYVGLDTPVATITGLIANHVPDFETVVTGDDEYLIFGDGYNTNLKFDGTTWTNLSLPQPTAPTLTDFAAGVLPAGSYYYYVSFARTVGGVIVQESELSPISAVLTIAANRQIRVTIPVCTETLATGVTAQCNARVIYRQSITDGVVYRLTTVADNTTLTYDDNTAADGSIEAEFDNEAAPLSAIFELDDFGQVWFQNQDKLTDTYTSKAYKPWNVPTANITIFDAGVTCIKRCFGTLIIGTSRSLWVQNGTFETTDARKFNSLFGILNNRCAAPGNNILYIMASNRKVYAVTATDFSQDQMRVGTAMSEIINSYFNQIGAASNEDVVMEYYTKANVAKLVISAPLGGNGSNNYLLIFNELQAQVKNAPVWQPWNNINASCLKLMNVSGDIGLYSGDYNGFLWLLDDDVTNGDGAEDNGTVTSATSTTLTDTTKTWTVNKFVGIIVRATSGAGADQFATITSNTADTLTFTPAITTAFNSATEYTIGGYDTYHFTNWKSITGSYDTLKQLWFLIANANASGDYPITVILQFDFNQSLADQITINFSLSAGNTIWGDFLWGAAIWGAFSVFQSRYRQNSKFRAVRFGFYNRLAGQPFQINGFSVSCQDKGLFYANS